MFQVSPGWAEELRRRGKEPVPAPSRSLPGGRVLPQSKFDAAQTWRSNRGYWGGADNASPRSANNLGVRQKLRSRSRYECDNNGYAGGLILGLADDTVGTGPRLQVLLPNPAHNAAIEAAWNLWAEGEGADPTRSVGLAAKLHLMAQARPKDGEGFGLLTTREDLISPVKLDVIVIETDQFTTPSSVKAGPVDGVELDAAGRPAFWHVLREHPGETVWYTGEYDRVPASRVLHWFRPTRPGQVRGVPEITSSLPIYSQMRRWTEATLTAAETAAKLSAVLKPDKDSPVDTSIQPVPFEAIEIEDGMMVTLLPGDEMEQFKAEHPTTEYPMFKQELLKEAGRPVRAPYNRSAGDSSPYNYSSAQMDEGQYWDGVRVVRNVFGKPQVLDRLFWAFIQEGRLIEGFLPPNLPDVIPHVWHWTATREIDPLKSAKTDTERLGNCTTTLSAIYAEKGLDWEEQLVQLAKEVERCEELGLTHPAAKALGMAAAPEPPPEEDTSDEEGSDQLEDRPAAFMRNGHAANGRCHP